MSYKAISTFTTVAAMGGYGGDDEVGPGFGRAWPPASGDYANPPTQPFDYENAPDGAFVFIDLGGNTLELTGWEVTAFATEYEIEDYTDTEGDSQQRIVLAGNITTPSDATPTWVDVQSVTEDPDEADSFVRGYRISSSRYELPIGIWINVNSAKEANVAALRLVVYAERTDGTVVTQSCIVPIGITGEVASTSNVALIHYEDHLHGGPLNGGEDSLDQILVQNSYTEYTKRDLAWDPVREEVIYSVGDPFGSEDHDIYRSPLDGSNAAEKILDVSVLASVKALQVFGRDLFVIMQDGTSKKVDLDSLLVTDLSDPPNGNNHFGQLGVLNGTLYGVSGDNLYQIDPGGSDWSWIQIKDLGDRAFRLCADGGLLWFRLIGDDNVYTYDPSTDILTDKGWSQQDAVYGFTVVNGLAYIGGIQPDNDIGIYDAQDGTLVQGGVYEGGTTGTVHVIIPITKQL